jgi:hypothetical protein
MLTMLDVYGSNGCDSKKKKVDVDRTRRKKDDLGKF